ncbi:MAG: Metal-dependent hydrolase of the beta-lactamase superfamily [Anaerocolumna sp.]|jgi:ribonuclease Z|nr:Metal-dependent hydrolase of the beta-lactamase superfamily [Anaerocolumna sp.]
MDEIIVLGTGNAQAIRVFNTCFALRSGNEYVLVDAGGGNGILSALDKNHIPMENIHHIFVSHEHTDHILGIPWMIRMIGAKMNQGSYQDNLYIYCHEELVTTIRTIVSLTVQKKFYQHFDDRMIFVPLKDGDTKNIVGSPFTFFDIKSTKAKQFGFTVSITAGNMQRNTTSETNRIKLTFTGDEPYRDKVYEYVQGSDWLLHEAFCLYSQRDIFKPYEKFHSTVKEACELAEQLKIPNLVLWHTEDKTTPERKIKYGQEGHAFYKGNLFIPDDGDIIPLL